MDTKGISFGAPAAERDIHQGLKDYFCETDTYRRIESGQKYLLLGNRGSGKSAILKILNEREKAKGSIIIELSPEEYSYEILNSTLLKECQGAWAKQGAFTCAWKYMLWVIIMKSISSHSTSIKTGALGKIYEYLRDNHKGTAENPISVLVSYIKRIEGVKVGPYEAGIKVQELHNLYKLEEINRLIPFVTEVAKKRRILVLIDELDKGWDASEDAKCFVAGLFQAAISINSVSQNLRVLVSLRKELYDNIPALYEDSQKIVDVIETVSWDEPTLLALMAKRIRYLFPDLKDSDDPTCWHFIFAETLDYRKTKSFNYLVDRTLYRPRELIQFASICTENYARGESSKVNYDLISRAEYRYSEQRTKDIAAEYRFQYPGLLKVFEAFRGQSYNLTRDAIDNVALQLSLKELDVGEASGWISDEDPENIIEILWRIGFLRAKAVGGVKALRRSGSSYLGSHQITSLHLPSIGNFHVHPMFRSYLGLKEARGRIVDDDE
jgi:energy-coupling factor transporter ATP-binding protein EcfA2